MGSGTGSLGLNKISTFVVLALIVLGSACADPASDAFRFGLASAPANLDPRFATDATSARINRLLYDRLVDFNDAFEPVPALADWEQLSPTHYRFHLTTNEHPFHDGTPADRQRRQSHL